MKSVASQRPGALSPTDAVIDEYFTRLMNEQIRDEFGTEPIPMATPKAPVSPGRGRRRLAAVAVSVAMAFSVLLVVVLTGCSAAPQGELAAAKKLLASCPTAQLAGYAEIDTSGSVRAAAMPEAYAGALRDLVRRTAVCGGHLHVGAFSDTAASTVTLYDGDLQMPGSTENARLRRVPQAVEDVMKTVDDAYSQKVPGLSPGGTDILAQYRLAHEYLQQLSGTRQLDLLLLTDGYQNAGFVLGDRALADAEAKALATQADVPQLPGARITVAGIGKTAGQDSASTDIITGMKVFYDALCQRTGATTCVSVTDHTPTGG